MGLHFWARGAAAGQPLDFTYGPLGFLSEPANWVRLTAAMAVAAAFVVRAALAYLLMRLLLPRGMLVGSLVALWLVMALPATGETSQVAECLAFVWAVCRLEQGRPPRPWSPVLEGMAVGLLALVKPGSALVALAVLGLVNIALGAGVRRGRLLAPVGFLVATVGAAVAGWALSGQPMSQLLPWLHASKDLISGYGAMAIEEAGRGPEYVWAFAGMVLAGCLWWAALGAGRRWAVMLVLGFLYLELKHGFVRHDQHATGFFVALLLALLLIPRGSAEPTSWTKSGHVALVQVAALLLLSVSRYQVSAIPGPIPAVRSLFQEGARLASAGQWQEHKRHAQAAMAQTYALGPDVLAAAHGGLQVDPWDAGVAFAYDLEWHPVPVFQPYSAFTPWLDGRNADAVTGGNAPPRILRSRTFSSIDGRFGLFDSPRYQFEVLCRYHEIAADPNWQVLGVGPSRCGSVRRLAELDLTRGRTVAVPAPSGPGSAVIARITIARAWTDRLRDLALKSSHTPGICLDDRCYRFVAATAEGPLVIRKANWMPQGPGGGADLGASTLRLSDVAGKARVEFFEVFAR